MIFESIIIAFIISKFLDGNFKKILNINIKYKSIIFIGVILNISIILLTSYDFGYLTSFIARKYKYLHTISLFFMMLGLMFNYKNTGIFIMSFGFLFNLIPIFLNGKMPVDYTSLLKTKNIYVIETIISGNSLSHGIFESPKAFYISDIIPLVPPYPFPRVISIGDIIISIGLVIAIVLEARSEK